LRQVAPRDARQVGAHLDAHHAASAARQLLRRLPRPASDFEDAGVGRRRDLGECEEIVEELLGRTDVAAVVKLRDFVESARAENPSVVVHPRTLTFNPFERDLSDRAGRRKIPLFFSNVGAKRSWQATRKLTRALPFPSFAPCGPGLLPPPHALKLRPRPTGA